MKKILLALTSLALTAGLCSCSSDAPIVTTTPAPIPEIDPASLITVDDVATNTGYTPVVEPTETTRDGNRSSVLYVSDPLGQYDPVKVTLTQFTDTIDYEQIFSEYEADKASRAAAELIGGIGQEAYIAFPTIHVYDRGCLIEITAGSGADDTQRNLLKGLAITAASRLESVIPDQTGK